MSAVIDLVEDALSAVWDAFSDVVEALWDAIVEPILEEIFSWFGIEDETIITVKRISTAIYDTNVDDVVQAGIARAIIKKIRNDTSFFPNYMEQIFKTKAQIKAYFRYGELNLYYNGLPDMRIKGTVVNFVDVQAALDTEFGSTHTVLSAISRNPTEFQYYYWEMQTINAYQAWTNTLTFTDSYGATRAGWFVDDIIYNSGPNDYTINISRTMEVAEFYIQGPAQITEGDTATYTIKSNRTVPNNKQITISFTYAGTAVDGVDYTQVASVIMLENTNEITVDLITAETANANRTIAITINSIDNTGGVFEEVNINAIDTVTTTITDDDSLLLTMNDVLVNEANVTITINVKLEQVAPSGTFDVDYNFTDLGGITGGVDYDNTTGTLTFAGTAGEIQPIMIDIYADVADDDLEQFEVFLENSTDTDSIDISAVATVTIVDNTSAPTQDTVIVNETITKSPAFVKENSLIVTYSDDNEPLGQFSYWVYPHSNITYDLLPTHTVITDLEMLPMAIIRKDKIQLDVEYGPTDPEFLTTKLLMARLGFEIDKFLKAIAENPDIGDINDCYLNFSIQPLDVNPIISKMLYLAWNQIIVISGLQSNVDQLSATIKEGDIENALVWSGHTFTPGIIGVVTTEGDYIHSISGTTLTMQFQKTATAYDEIIMTNLNGMTSINYQAYHEVSLSKLGDDEFTIPISWDIFQKITAQEQMKVYQFICRLDLNALNITELEWYETQDFLDLFEFALVALAIVLTIAGLDGNSFYTYAMALVEQLVVNYAIGELIIYIAEATGSEFLAALAGVAASIYLRKPELLSSNTLIQAETLIDLSTEFANNLLLVESVQAQEIADELLEDIKKATDRLEEAEKNRPDISAVTLNSEFLASVQSIDTTYYPAIKGQYNYDQVYNYDSLIADFYSNRLQIGVN